MKKPLKITLAILSFCILIASFTLASFADSGLLTPTAWNYYTGAEELTIYRDSDAYPDGYFNFNTDGYTQRLGTTTTSTVWRDRLSCYYDNNGSASNIVIDAYNEYIESTNYNFGLLNKTLDLGVDSSGFTDFYPTHIGFKDMFAYQGSYQSTSFAYPLASITVSPADTQWIDNALNAGSMPIGFTTLIHTDTSSINTRRIIQNVTYRTSTLSNGNIRYDLCLDLSSVNDLYTNNGYAYLMDIGLEFTPTAVNEMSYGETFILSLYTWHFDDTTTVLTDFGVPLKLLPTHYLDNFLDIDVFISGEDFSLYDFFSSAIGGFFEFEFAPGFTLGAIGFTVISIGLLFAILKYFAGG